MTSLHVRYLKSLTEKTRGLLGHDEATPVLIKTRFGIHTFGMKFPIDILILDKNLGIVKQAHDLKPNNLFLWSPQHDTVIELPSGEIKKMNLKIGDHVKLEVT